MIQEELSARILEVARVGVWEWKPQASETRVDPNWCRILGYPVTHADENLLSPHETLHPDDKESLFSALKKHFENETGFFEHSHRLLRADGEWQWVLERGSILERGPNGEPEQFVGLVIPVDEVKKLESMYFEQHARLAASSKMTALGEMAGGIAHEINNPLAVIDGHAYRCLRIIERENFDLSKLTEALSKIRLTIQRIKKIVSSLRTLSRNTELDSFEKVDIREVIQDVLGLIGEKCRNHGIKVEVIENLQAPSLVIAQRVSLSQVFLNLITNSFDAIDGQNEACIRIEIDSFQNEIEVRVIDNGPGVLLNIQDKIFEPFFTTKQVGKGTGLGLSLSKTIIEKHGGQISLNSKISGSCFVIRIPSAESPWTLARDSQKKEMKNE